MTESVYINTTTDGTLLAPAVVWSGHFDNSPSHVFMFTGCVTASKPTRWNNKVISELRKQSMQSNETLTE